MSAHMELTKAILLSFFHSNSPPKSDVQLLISGAPAKGNKDFPPEAIQSYHHKPQPTHQKPRDNRQKHVFQQPPKKM